MNVLRSVVPNQAWLLKERGVFLSIGGYCSVLIVLVLVLLVVLEFLPFPRGKAGRFAYGGKAGTLCLPGLRIDAEGFRRDELVKVLVIGSGQFVAKVLI